MNAAVPSHVLPLAERRRVPAAMHDALKARFGERCSTALARKTAAMLTATSMMAASRR